LVVLLVEVSPTHFFSLLFSTPVYQAIQHFFCARHIRNYQDLMDSLTAAMSG
jgi:hypothetical protein